MPRKILSLYERMKDPDSEKDGFLVTDTNSPVFSVDASDLLVYFDEDDANKVKVKVAEDIQASMRRIDEVKKYVATAESKECEVILKQIENMLGQLEALKRHTMFRMANEKVVKETSEKTASSIAQLEL